MKKLIALLIGLMMVVSVFAGCQTTEPADTQTDAPETNPEATVSGGIAEETTPTTAPEEEPQYGGTFVWAQSGDPNTLLYAWLTSGWTNRMSSFINDKLFIVDAEGNIEEYRVCDSYTVSDDGLVYTFHIRDGVKWHDGTPVLASDVVWTNNVQYDPNWFMSLQFQLPGTWETVDDSTFTVTLTEPSNNLLYNMMDGLHIQPEHYYEGVDPSEFYSCKQAYEPIGCGPFKFVEYKVGDYLKMEAFDDFWAGRPYLDAAFIKITGGSQYTEIALESGQVSCYTTTEDYYEEIKDSDQFQFLIGPSSMVAEVSFDFHLYKLADIDLEKPLYTGDRVIREAISYMIPYEEIIDKVLRGACIRSYSIVPSDGQWYTEEGMNQPYYDLDKANQILDDAGYVDTDGDGIRNWKDGSNISIKWSYYDAGGANERMSVLMAENCQNCGILSALTTEEQTSWLETFVSADEAFDPNDIETTANVYYYGGYGSDAYGYYNMYASWGDQGFFKNWDTGEFYTDEEKARCFEPAIVDSVARSDEALKAMETDHDNGAEYFKTFQQIWTNEIISEIPIGTMQRRIAFQANIRGIDKALWRTNNNYLGFAMERIWIDPNA